MENKQVDYEKYAEFVETVTSKPSLDYDTFLERVNELSEDIPVQRLLTAAVGMSAESGEFMEIIKKIIFQGKPANEENLEHLMIELGDIMWYVMQACGSLGITLDEVVARNVRKLEKRYPEGQFNVYRSEIRATDDK